MATIAGNITEKYIAVLEFIEFYFVVTLIEQLWVIVNWLFWLFGFT